MAKYGTTSRISLHSMAAKSLHHVRNTSQNRKGRLPGPCWSFSLWLRRLRAGRLGRGLLALLELVQQSAALPAQRRCRGARRRRRARRVRSRIQDGCRIAMEPCQDREQEARREESARKIGGGAGQYVGGAAAGEEACRRTRRKAATLRLLQEHEADHGEHNHEMDDNDELFHENLSVNPSRPRVT